VTRLAPADEIGHIIEIAALREPDNSVDDVVNNLRGSMTTFLTENVASQNERSCRLPALTPIEKSVLIMRSVFVELFSVCLR